MNRKRLIAALGEVREKLALIEAMLENGDDAGALDLLGDVENAWAVALQEIRA